MRCLIVLCAPFRLFPGLWREGLQVYIRAEQQLTASGNGDNTGGGDAAQHPPPHHHQRRPQPPEPLDGSLQGCIESVLPGCPDEAPPGSMLCGWLLDHAEELPQ